jgi:hypothetical protein
MKETIKNTTNSSVYNKLYKEHLFDYYGLCPYCPFNGGCNRGFGVMENRNWKKFRKTQYKE